MLRALGDGSYGAFQGERVREVILRNDRLTTPDRAWVTRDCRQSRSYGFATALTAGMTHVAPIEPLGGGRMLASVLLPGVG